MKTLYETIIQSLFQTHKIGESILSKSGVGKMHQIQTWLDEHGIKNYTINNKGEVDVDGDVNLMRKGLAEFPSFIQFGTIKGNFDCSYNNLTSLKGAPREVGGRFDCSYNHITSLEGSPENVGENFICYYNSTKFSKEDVIKVCKVGKSIIV